MSSMSKNLNITSSFLSKIIKNDDISKSRPPLISIVLKKKEPVMTKSDFTFMVSELFNMNETDSSIAFDEYDVCGKTNVGTFSRDVAETKMSNAVEYVNCFSLSIILTYNLNRYEN